MQDIKTEILITEMVVSNEAKNVVPLKFLLKIEKTFFSIRGHTVYQTNTISSFVITLVSKINYSLRFRDIRY
jgi:hypothetical protein